MDNQLALWMFAVVFVILLSGYPVAFVLGGTALAFATIGLQFEVFDPAFPLIGKRKKIKKSGR